jgi:hypothetical protein
MPAVRRTELGGRHGGHPEPRKVLELLELLDALEDESAAVLDRRADVHPDHPAGADCGRILLRLLQRNQRARLRPQWHLRSRAFVDRLDHRGRLEVL